MSSGSAHIHAAIATAWDNYGIDDEFTQYWTTQQKQRFLSLNDGEAAPGQPFPYCVFEQPAGTVSSRMSGCTWTEKHIIHDVPWTFRVHASAIDARSAKDVAASLVDMIMWRFGGHPTKSPSVVTLAAGQIANIQYQTDYGVRTGDDEYQWNVVYLITADVPVATG